MFIKKKKLLCAIAAAGILATGTVGANNANKDDLRELIGTDVQNSSAYTPITYQEYEECLSKAIEISDEFYSASDEIEEAYANLQTSIEQLQLLPDKSSLQEAYHHATNIDQVEYIPLSVNALQNAVSIALNTLNDPNATIDEVDQAGNYPQFLSFLGVLRNKYLNRDEIATFQSVILAGVHDIKNLKLKMRQEDEHQYNSPWNIAANFNIDMSFSVQEIEGMLAEYESEHSTNMRTKEMAELLYDYTSGYPFLVSRICKMIDEELSSQAKYNGNAWRREGILEAVRNLLIEKNTLFDSLDAKIANYPELKNILFKNKTTQQFHTNAKDGHLIN